MKYDGLFPAACLAASLTLMGLPAGATSDLPALQSLVPRPLPAPFNAQKSAGQIPEGQVEGLQPTPPSVPSGPGKPVHGELNDGTQVEFDADGSVFILGKDGAKDPAPDGVLTLKDGVTFTVRNGERVEE